MVIKLVCYLLIASVPLAVGDERFARSIAGMLSHLVGQPVTEQLLEEIAFIHEELKELPYVALPTLPTSSGPKVMTTSGEVEGTTNEQAHSFYEIPYAEPPVADLRFQPPKPIINRREIDARRNSGTRCPQLSGPLTPQMQEDCLVLNVYSPISVDLTDAGLAPTQRLPVLVYIHGGAFTGGRSTSSGLDGNELAAVTNMVIVTINYRLGALGFLVHREDGYPDIEGNQGLKDQQLALRWVQDNIENFGGDKTRVTISGTSAGGQSVMFHTLSPISEPLYNNAIQQSNPAVFTYQTPEESLVITNILLGSLRCNASLSERECLMTADSQALARRQISVMLRSFLTRDVMGFIEPFRPIIDGEEFTDHPLHLYRDGKWNSHKDMITGVATEELENIQYVLPAGLEYNQLLFEFANYYLLGPGMTDKVVKKYEKDYAPAEGKNWASTFSTEMTHLYFICPSRALARYASATATNSAKVYFYAFDHPVLDGACAARNETDCYFATHGSEIRYLFRTRSNVTADDETVEDQLGTYWGSFARTGAPSNGLETSLGDFTDWPIYTEELATDFSPIVKGKRPLEVFAKLLPQMYQSKDLGSGEFLPDNPWESIRIKAPNSDILDDYEGDICDFWDSVGYYMDPIPLPPINTDSTTTTTLKSTSAAVLETTSGATISRYSALLIGVLSVFVLNKNFHSHF